MGTVERRKRFGWREKIGVAAALGLAGTALWAGCNRTINDQQEAVLPTNSPEAVGTSDQFSLLGSGESEHAGPTMGGSWISPREGEIVVGPVNYEADVYPLKAGDPGISQVDFLARSSGGPGFMVVCTDNAPEPGTTIYRCSWDPLTGGNPTGEYAAGINVTNMAGEMTSVGGLRNFSWDWARGLVMGGNEK